MKGVKKSRNGCLRCKRQKLKCDETKPQCGRCVRVGGQCPGYTRLLKWSTKYEAFSSNAEITSSPLSKCSQHNRHSGIIPSALLPQGSTQSPEDNLATDDLFDFDLGQESLVEQLHLDEGASSPLVQNTDSMLPEIAAQHDFPLQEFPSISPDLLTNTRNIKSKRGNNVIFPLQNDDPELPFNLFSFRLPVKEQLWHMSHAPIVPSISTMSSTLIDVYFRETAKIYSIYDGRMNPFRTSVAEIWDKSPLVQKTMQSMAAANLTELFPQMGPLGQKLRREALALLDLENNPDFRTLLAILMLGGSGNWLDTKDFGIPIYNIYRARLKSIIHDEHVVGTYIGNQFFHECTVYWEMLLAFITDYNSFDFCTKRLPIRNILPSHQVPHPWSGIAQETQIILQQVGKLIRQQRIQVHSKTFITKAHITRLQRSLALAGELESRLLSLVYPSENEILNPEDHETPIWHLLHLAEIYRRTGLVQLYHVFPDILSRRLKRDDLNISSSAAHLEESIKVCQTDYKTWLTTFTLSTLALLKSIPIESGTRDFQPFLLVALSSELHMPTSFSDTIMITDAHLPPQLKELGSDFVCPSIHVVETSRMRQFVKGRLTTLLNVLPPKPMRMALLIVDKVWEEMDRIAADRYQRVSGRWNSENMVMEVSGNEYPAITGLDILEEEQEGGNVFWLDVMIENGWEFMV
ncbi:hypothetical protein M501DRAFT_991220 [Patellaria atrata CBS 101060]|uniref:Zn(2)-C6 fungal-type domain-containing protein n=1 Tax=Patellaria atrata CBS 101060 TaxID=1346257 RepID=A0A9P4VU29_9PEZI|nr:hypothetical protein M501DRAFT_991220 [Patellaria atrata CBS 101060]